MVWMNTNVGKYKLMVTILSEKIRSRAVPISLFADYTDTEWNRWFKQPIHIMLRPVMTPITRSRLKADVLTKRSHKIAYLTLKISFFSHRAPKIYLAYPKNWIFLYDDRYRRCWLFSPIPITTDTSNNRPDYEYYRCIGTALYKEFVGSTKFTSHSDH